MSEQTGQKSPQETFCEEMHYRHPGPWSVVNDGTGRLHLLNARAQPIQLTELLDFAIARSVIASQGKPL